MELEPIFFGMPDEESDLAPGITFSLLGFSRFGEYTLVRWMRGDEEEAITGETLWQGLTLETATIVAWSGGELPLIPEGLDPAYSYANTGIAEMAKAATGTMGIPLMIAQELRSPTNYRAFRT